MNNGDEITPDAIDAFTLNFSENGQISGVTDCNSFNGSYELTDKEIDFGSFAMTKKYCENSQEQRFINFVQESKMVYFSDEGNLVLLLPVDSGSVIFTAK